MIEQDPRQQDDMTHDILFALTGELAAFTAYCAASGDVHLLIEVADAGAAAGRRGDDAAEAAIRIAKEIAAGISSDLAAVIYEPDCELDDEARQAAFEAVATVTHSDSPPQP